jgi:hypothetical protein
MKIISRDCSSNTHHRGTEDCWQANTRLLWVNKGIILLSIDEQLQDIICTHLRSKPVFQHTLDYFTLCYVH